MLRYTKKELVKGKYRTVGVYRWVKSDTTGPRRQIQGKAKAQPTGHGRQAQAVKYEQTEKSKQTKADRLKQAD